MDRIRSLFHQATRHRCSMSVCIYIYIYVDLRDDVLFTLNSYLLQSSERGLLLTCVY